MENLHNSVMINEIISFLPLTKSINVIDATFGGGGYSKAILEKLLTPPAFYVCKRFSASVPTKDKGRALLVAPLGDG